MTPKYFIIFLLIIGCSNNPTGPDPVVPVKSSIKIQKSEPSSKAPIGRTDKISVFFDKEIDEISVIPSRVFVKSPGVISGSRLVDSNKVTFIPYEPYQSGGIVYFYINIRAKDGSVIDTVINFQVTGPKFAKPDNYSVNSLYVDKKNRLYYAGSSPNTAGTDDFTGFLSRYLPTGELDTTASLEFIQEMSSVSKVVTTDNGNIYASFSGDRIGFSNNGIAEFDSNFNFLSVHFEEGIFGRMVAVGNEVYYLNNNNTITRLLSRKVVGANFNVYYIIYDQASKQLIVGGQLYDQLITAAYSLELDLLWQRELSIEGYSFLLVKTLGKQYSGNYLIFAQFLYGPESSKIMRVEYTSAGEFVDSTDVGNKVEIRDMQPCPINDAVVVRYDLPHGDVVAVLITTEFQLYVTAVGKKVKFFDIRTKQEVVF